MGANMWKGERAGRLVQVLDRRTGNWVETEVRDLEVGDVARMIDNPTEERPADDCEVGDPFLVALDPFNSAEGTGWSVQVVPIGPPTTAYVIAAFQLRSPAQG